MTRPRDQHARVPRFVRAAGFALRLAVLVPVVAAAFTPRVLAEDKSAAYLREHKAVVLAARKYFDLEGDYTDGLRALRPELERMAKAGTRVLADPRSLQWFVAQGRAFTLPFSDKARRIDFTGARAGKAGRVRWFQSQEFSCAFTLPRSYPASGMVRYPRPDPFPLVIALHEKSDTTGKKPSGVAALKRHYPYARFSRLHKRWLMLAPMAGAGRFLDKDGLVRHEVLTSTFREFWRCYHVDFARVILDGGQAALDVAGAMPYFFAGLVLRGGTLDTPAQVDSVRNFAPLPVYVVGDAKLAERLRLLGHPRVSLGDGSDLCAWMDQQRRRAPLRYAWDAPTPDKHGSYWINIDELDMASPHHRFEVRIEDTQGAPNTVHIEAEGIRSLSVFLDDTVLDLDRPVRVLINGHQAYSDSLAVRTLGRDLKSLFYRKPFRTRTSMYFGWLKPGWIQRLEVVAPAPK